MGIARAKMEPKWSSSPVSAPDTEEEANDDPDTEEKANDDVGMSPTELSNFTRAMYKIPMAYRRKFVLANFRRYAIGILYIARVKFESSVGLIPTSSFAFSSVSGSSFASSSVSGAETGELDHLGSILARAIPM